MDFVIDGILILTCVSAGFYCYVLSRRLKKFSDTETGIGEQILSLNSTLDDVRGSMKGLKQEAEAAAEVLSKKIAQSQKVKAELQRRIEEIERTSESLQALGEEQPVRGEPISEGPAPKDDLGFGAAGAPEPDAETRPGLAPPESEVLSNFAPAPTLVEEADSVLPEAPEEDDGIQSLGFIPPTAPSAEDDETTPSDQSKKPDSSRRSGDSEEDAFLSVERMLL